MASATASETSKNEPAKGATETLSQLLAKILNQLSLSAWLPAAFLVLFVGFCFSYASNLGSAPAPASRTEAVGKTLAHLSEVGFGAVALLVLAIVVSTMLTQAFTFMAIRLLEGYWGTTRLTDVFGGWMSRWHRRRRRVIVEKYDSVINAVWNAVEVQARAEKKNSNSPKPMFTERMLAELKQRVTGVAAAVKLTSSQYELVHAYLYDEHVDLRLTRRQRALEMRLLDYPALESHIMPTRLGNIIRQAEDETGQADVEHFVERVFDELPFSLQLDHDEQRGRLDLYCSMCFVTWMAAGLSSGAFVPEHPRYSLILLTGALLSSIVCYLAAVAAGRYYASILIRIADFVSQDGDGAAQAATSTVGASA